MREERLPEVGVNQVRVRTLYSGISRGTEAVVFEGRVPETEHETMRAPFQDGQFPFPVKYGYACVGEIEKGPPERLGETVFCLHPHQDRFVVPAGAAAALPEGIPARRAILAANMETAVNGIWDSRPCPGDRITVIGAGVVGSLVAWLAGQIPGCRVVLVDVLEERRSVADELGVEFAIPEQAPGEQDLVVHASGSDSGLDLALGLAGQEATVLEMSWYGDKPVTVGLGQSFHSRRLTLKSSQVGSLPVHRQARWDHTSRLDLALDLLADPRLDVLVDDSSLFDQLPDNMPRILAGQGLCHCIEYAGKPASSGR